MNLDLLLLTQELSQQGKQDIMSEEIVTRVTLDPNNPSKGKTDWEQVDTMTEEEIHAAALSDPDAQPVTSEELEEFKPVTDAKAIRESMNLTQKESKDDTRPRCHNYRRRA